MEVETSSGEDTEGEYFRVRFTEPDQESRVSPCTRWLLWRGMVVVHLAWIGIFSSIQQAVRGCQFGQGRFCGCLQVWLPLCLLVSTLSQSSLLALSHPMRSKRCRHVPASCPAQESRAQQWWPAQGYNLHRALAAAHKRSLLLPGDL